MRSLKHTLLVSILGGLTLVLVVAGVAVFAVARANFRAQLDTALLDRAQTFATLVVDDADDGLEFDYDQSLDEAALGVFLRVTTDDGHALAQSADWPEASVTSENVRTDGTRLQNLRLADGGDARSVAIARRAVSDPPVREDGSPSLSAREVNVEVIGRTDGVTRAETAILFALIVGGIAAILGSTVAVWFGVRRGLAPVRSLGEAVDRIDTDELTMPARPEHYPEELHPIVSALDGLLERSRAAMARERRFTDAAAHELRTPIAELKTITDVADRWPEPERLHRSIKDAGCVVGQMEALLVSLLAAARGTTDDSDQPAEAVALLPLARTIAGDLSTVQEEDVAWTFEGDDESAWIGPRGIVVAIVRNLVENAAEYTPVGGAVRVAVTSELGGEGSPDRGRVTLEVENGPVSLEPSEVEQLFEPFWRADSSRTGRTHRGLGLTIVQTLAGGLGLERQADILPEGRLRLRLTSLARGKRAQTK